MASLLELTECNAEGVVERSVWVNPDHLLYVVQHAGVSHLKMSDGSTVFTVELPPVVAGKLHPPAGEQTAEPKEADHD
jgi:hypothetical protein